jgi:DNA-binding response OmpR family regulator
MTTWRALLVLEEPVHTGAGWANGIPMGYAVRIEADASGELKLSMDGPPYPVPLELARVGDGSAVSEPVYRHGAIQIDFASRRVQRDGCEVELTAREFKVLAYLAVNAGKIRTVAEIFEAVWGRPLADESASVWTYICRLRHKLEADPARPVHLLSRGRLGYFMARPDGGPE